VFFSFGSFSPPIADRGFPATSFYEISDQLAEIEKEISKIRHKIEVHLNELKH